MIINDNLLGIYAQSSLLISQLQVEIESKEYEACRYQFNGVKVISRSSKITPKKSGQFVTFWKRQIDGPIEPFSELDDFDFFVVSTQVEGKLGLFVFPKSILIKQSIISTQHKEGKRAFRVYPSWDTPTSKQALKTQQWQLNYFHEINGTKNLNNLFTV